MIYEHDQYLELPMTSSYTPSALEFAVRRPGRGNWHLHALAWARVPAWACRLGGREAGRAWCQGGLPPGKGGSSGGLDFWKKWQFVIIISRKIITKQQLITPQSRRAHRDSTAEASGRLQLDDPCELWASLARQPIDRAASLLGSKARALRGPERLDYSCLTRVGVLG